MQPENRIPTHPGELLLKPLDVTQFNLAMHIGVLVPRINEIGWGVTRRSC